MLGGIGGRLRVFAFPANSTDALGGAAPTGRLWPGASVLSREEETRVSAS